MLDKSIHNNENKKNRDKERRIMNKDFLMNCKICTYYLPEEIGDSDYGPIYANKCTCKEENDVNKLTDEYVEGFDYDSVKECCVPEFWIAADKDPEISELLIKEVEMADKIEETNAYRKFREKYKQRQR
jgi:hypothetical protein